MGALPSLKNITATPTNYSNLVGLHINQWGSFDPLSPDQQPKQEINLQLLCSMLITAMGHPPLT
jgi:hypothetical protein